MSCSLDENNDDIPEYTNNAPLNLRVNKNPFMLGDTLAEDRENLQVEFKDVWGEAHLHSGNCSLSLTTNLIYIMLDIVLRYPNFTVYMHSYHI